MRSIGIRSELTARWLVLALVLAASLAGLAPSGTATAQSSSAQLTVITPSLNVRSGPGVNYPVVSALQQGAQVEITGKNGAAGWWQIKLSGGAAGWVSGAAELVQANAAAGSVPEVAAASVPVSATAGSAPVARSAGKTMVFQAASGSDIYAINSDGSGLRRLTTGMDPILSADGQRVAFTRWQGSFNGASGSLWVINLDGSGERKIADNLNQPKSPAWSPDGKQIVVNMQRGGRLDAQLVPFLKEMPTGPTDFDGCFIDVKQPDGSVQQELVPCFKAPADPWWWLRSYNLADGSFKDLASDQYAFAPTWNPTNNWQVVYAGKKGLFSMDVNRDANWRVTTDPDDRSPAYAPDGKRVAIAYHQHDHWEIYAMNPDGSGRVRLTETPYNVLAEAILKGQPARNWNNGAPVWSPDGKQIAFVTDRTGKWEFWIMNADGSNQRALFPAGALAGINLQYHGVDERMLSWR